MRSVHLSLALMLTVAAAVLCGCVDKHATPPLAKSAATGPAPTPAAAPAPAAMPDFPDLKPSKKYRIALVMKTMSNPFFQAMDKGAQGEAKRLGIELSSLAAPKETSDLEQAGIVENEVAKGVAAICIAPADSKSLIPALLKADQAHIPVINLDNRIDRQAAQEAGLKLVTFIGPDNEAGAEKAAKYLAEKMGGGGKVAMLEGIQGVDNAEARKRGFEKAMKAAPGITVVDSQSAHWELEQGESVFANMLTAHPDLTGLFCANDMMALGALRAIDAAGKRGKLLVASYDNLAAAQEKIRSGDLLCTIEQHPDLMGAWAVRCAVALLEGKQIPPEIAVPTDLITKETLGKR